MYVEEHSTAPDGDGVYKAGQRLQIAVVFDQAIDYSRGGGIKLNLGDAGKASFFDVVGNKAIFRLTIPSGKTFTNLNYLSANALEIGASSAIESLDGSTTASYTLPPVNSANSLAGRSNINVIGKAPASTISSVAYDKDIDSFIITGDKLSEILLAGENHKTNIKDRLAWNKFVIDWGNDGAVTADKTFDRTADITGAYVLSDNQIRIQLKGTAATALESLSTFGSAAKPDMVKISNGFLKNAADQDGTADGINTELKYNNVSAPVVKHIATTIENGKLVLTVSMSAVVNVTGTPQINGIINDSTTATANYISGAGTNTLRFEYEFTTDTFNRFIVKDINLNGGTIKSSGNVALT